MSILMVEKLGGGLRTSLPCFQVTIAGWIRYVDRSVSRMPVPLAA